MPKKRRLRWLDIARGICILSMVTCHFSAWTGLIPVFTGFTGTWFLLFFFFASGLCYRTGTKQKKGRFILRQAKKLLLPYTIALPILFYHVYNMNLWHTLPDRQRNQYAIASWLYALPSGFHDIPPFGVSTIGVGPIWFLPCLFFSLVLFSLLAPYYGRTVIATLLLLLASWSQTVLLLPFSLQNACVGCFFLVLGANMREKILEGVKVLQKKSPLWLVLGLFVFYLLLSSSLLFLPYQLVNLGGNYYNPLSLISTLLGFCFVTFLALLLERIPVVRDIFSIIGQETFSILLLHTIDLQILRRWKGQDFPFLFGTLLGYIIFALFLHGVKRFFLLYRLRTQGERQKQPC